MNETILLQKLRQSGFDQPVQSWRAVRPQVYEVILLGGITVKVTILAEEEAPGSPVITPVKKDFPFPKSPLAEDSPPEPTSTRKPSSRRRQRGGGEKP